ncbi:hypothetical protein PIB30_056787 [Stylosanthes scabra]|uniref:Uncharacterized protein n=1 Tax=Stylosanthes scabra TaxID=79078 RepID=A0ABU6ZI76_9FABA|nr:hypothetical protein [Stylosanthes scabra]
MARNHVKLPLAILMIGLIIYSAVGEVQDVVPKQQHWNKSYEITSSYSLSSHERSRTRVSPKTPDSPKTPKEKIPSKTELLMNCFADCNRKYEIGSSDIINCVRECYKTHMNI